MKGTDGYWYYAELLNDEVKTSSEKYDVQADPENTLDEETLNDAIEDSSNNVNYKQFDLNGHGRISSQELDITFIIAGNEESFGGPAPNVWGHMLNLPSIRVQGKTLINNYSEQGEVHGDHKATVGIFCHELGHTLGLPDLYDYDSIFQGVGNHSVMGGGSWGGYPLNGLKIINVSGWGIAVWHIDEQMASSGYAINDNENHKGGDREEACTAALGYSHLDKNNNSYNKHDDYFHTGGITTFGVNISPSSRLYNGSNSNIAVSTNGAPSTEMNVTVNVSGEIIDDGDDEDNDANLKIIGALERPYNYETVNGNFPISGWALSGKSISKVEVLVDGYV